ncbi:MAG: ligase-associated DNA damage response DEXH box helicase [Planctomycetota bacterium]
MTNPHANLQKLTDWMRNRGRDPWAFQTEAWEAQLAGESGLIHVPTGAGKTYASYLGSLAEIATYSGPGLRVLYVTPLRAVSRDVEIALREPVDDLGLDVTIESRTGDTKSSVRQRQRERLPNVLITTPESLSLLLTRENAQDLFQGLRQAILDEWHELMSSKRGTQCELALARLRRWNPEMRTWALSATLSNVEEAAQAAAGVGSTPRVIRSDISRPLEITSVCPSETGGIAWAGHMGLRLLPEVLDALDIEHPTLVFCNTRSQAELWHQAIASGRPDWIDRIALHHGSLDHEERARVEAGLKAGDIRLVIATSSLDLGVDFAPVERVFQIGSPKGIARLIQRAGRAAHRPGEPCGITCVPTHGLELIEIVAVRRAAARGQLEPRSPELTPLDVLGQHMVTCAMGGGFTPEDLFEEVRTAFAFESLDRESFDWTLALVEQGGGTLKAYREFCKVRPDEAGVYRVPERRIAQMHRMNVGTITSDSGLPIRYQRGASLGTIEEGFVRWLKPGQRFVFAGKTLAFVGIRDGVVIVRKSTGTTNHTPHWAGTRLPISESMASAVREAMEAAGAGDRSTPELVAAAPIVDAQSALSVVPRSDQLLIELCETGEGRHMFLFPFEGRLVNGGLASLLAYRLVRNEPSTFTISFNDYGLELLAAGDYDFAASFSRNLFSSENLLEDTIASLNMGELVKLQFREVARVAGLVHQSFPGARKTGRQVMVSSGLIFDVLRDFDPGHLLLKQAEREVLERQFEQGRLSRLLARLRDSESVIVKTERPTPLGFPLVIERERGTLSSETILDRVERMRAAWEQDRSTSRSGASG